MNKVIGEDGIHPHAEMKCKQLEAAAGTTPTYWGARRMDEGRKSLEMTPGWPFRRVAVLNFPSCNSRQLYANALVRAGFCAERKRRRRQLIRTINSSHEYFLPIKSHFTQRCFLLSLLRQRSLTSLACSAVLDFSAQQLLILKSKCLKKKKKTASRSD